MRPSFFQMPIQAPAGYMPFLSEVCRKCIGKNTKTTIFRRQCCLSSSVSGQFSDAGYEKAFGKLV